MGFEAEPVLGWAKFFVGSCAAVTGNAINLETWWLPFGVICGLLGSEGGWPAWSCAGLSWEGLASGAAWARAVGSRAGRRRWGGARQAALPLLKLCSCFHHAVESDPHEELLGASQEEVISCKAPSPCMVGMNTAATKTIFSRKLLMNFAFPPLAAQELHLASVETSLGITSYSLKKKKNKQTI